MSITVGATTVSVNISGTNAQINAAIKRYAIHKSIQTTGRTASEIGTDVLASLKGTIKDGSTFQHRVEKMEDLRAALEAEIVADNDL